MLAQLLRDPVDHFFGVGHHPLKRHGWTDDIRVFHQIGLSGAALIPLHNLEVLFPTTAGGSARQFRNAELVTASASVNTVVLAASEKFKLIGVSCRKS
jgi:hypothetical protein